MLEDVKIFALGGLDENGKSLYVVDYNNQLYIFDCGLRYPEESLLGIDIILPGYQYLVQNKDKIIGFFLTHGHDENMGALPFIIEELDLDINVYGTKFTLLALQLTAKKFKKSLSHAKMHTIDVNADLVVNGTTFHFFEVSHGSPESCGIAMETEKGNIVYTGDFIFDISEKEPFATNISRICEIAKKETLILLSESYNAGAQGYIAPKHKMDLRLTQILDEIRGRMFISVYGQTVYQIKDIIKVAKQTRRKIYLYSQYAKETFEILKKEYPLFGINDALITTNIYERDCIVLISEMGNKVFEILTSIAELNDTDKSLKIGQEDAFVIASGPHAGTERSFAKILDILYKTNAHVINITKEIASMHASNEDLKNIINIFKPKYYMPVRGYYIKLIENAKLALDMGYNHMNILVYDNGMVVHLLNGNLIRGSVPIDATEMMVDGIGIGDVGNIVITDRRKLSNDGVLIIGCTFSMSTRKLVSGPNINAKGFLLNDNNEEIFTEIKKVFAKVVFDFIQRPGLVDFNELRNMCKEQISALLRSKIERDPMILPVIISV